MSLKEKLETVCYSLKQVIALAAVNAFAFVYDGQFLYAAIAVDILVLGYDIKAILVK